jgi:hypothetical protein
MPHLRLSALLLELRGHRRRGTPRCAAILVEPIPVLLVGRNYSWLLFAKIRSNDGLLALS